MSKRKLPWQYSTAESMRCGRMICTVCSKEITEGDYRFREDYGDRGFHAHSHRACLPVDQQEHWLRQDEINKARNAKLIEYREACKVFRDLWKTEALDEEISDLEHLKP